MAKQTTETKAENVSVEQGQLLEVHASQLSAIMSALVGGQDVSGIKKGDLAYTDALDEAIKLRAKFTASERLNGDLIARVDGLTKRVESASAPRMAAAAFSEPGFIILPDGQRINTRVIASYHPVGEAEIEFKTTDGKTLGTYSAPRHNAQGSIMPERRKEIRDQVVETLDEHVDAMK